MAKPTEAELLRQVDELRQLLQAGTLLASSVLAGEDVRDDLQRWVDATLATVGP